LNKHNENNLILKLGDNFHSICFALLNTKVPILYRPYLDETSTQFQKISWLESAWKSYFRIL